MACASIRLDKHAHGHGNNYLNVLLHLQRTPENGNVLNGEMKKSPVRVIFCIWCMLHSVMRKH